MTMTTALDEAQGHVGAYHRDNGLDERRGAGRRWQTFIVADPITFDPMTGPRNVTWATYYYSRLTKHKPATVDEVLVRQDAGLATSTCSREPSGLSRVVMKMSGRDAVVGRTETGVTSLCKVCQFARLPAAGS
jgi:hypothetical protein